MSDIGFEGENNVDNSRHVSDGALTATTSNVADDDIVVKQKGERAGHAHRMLVSIVFFLRPWDCRAHHSCSMHNGGEFGDDQSQFFMPHLA